MRINIFTQARRDGDIWKGGLRMCTLEHPLYGVYNDIIFFKWSGSVARCTFDLPYLMSQWITCRNSWSTSTILYGIHITNSIIGPMIGPL